MKRIFLTLATVVAVAASGLAPASLARGGSVSRDTHSATLIQKDSDIGMWIWADKYVYRPGEQATVRGSYRVNQDVQPYALFTYIINNQTGVRTFFTKREHTTMVPQNIFSQTPDDIDRGLGLTRLDAGVSAVNKAVIVGPGGSASGMPYTIPDELGMHTVVVQLRDYRGGRVLKNAYFKISVVDETVEVSGDISSDTTWVNTKTYNLNGVVFVKNGATLTIEPGTIITGEPGSQPASSLFVTTTGRLVAAGTRSRPVTFTSKLPFGERNAGDWGGLVLLGAAPVNWPTGFGNIEGLPPSGDTEYGGDDPTHDCGTLTYVRVEFAGAEFAPNDEINAITFGGCGSDTVAHHLQAKYGLDDLFEWFGGTMDASYLVGTYGQDDFLDMQIGWTGRLQHAVCVAGEDQQGNRGIESDNNEDDYAATPVTEPQVYNVTMVGAGDTYTEGFDEGTGVAGAYFRRGSGGSYNNVLIYNWVNTGLVVLDQASIDNRALSVDGLLMWNNGLMSGRSNTMADQVVDPLGSKDNLGPEFLPGQANVMIADPDLVRPLQLSDPDFRPRGGGPVFRANWILPPDDGFFDQSANYLGAFGDERWDEEWVQYHVEGEMGPP